MRFAVITDVHGNAAALKAVLAEIDRRKDIDHIYSLGDMVGIGPDTNEVLETLFSRDNVSMITGNHDEAVLALHQGQEYPKRYKFIREHHEWIADKIDPAFVSHIEKIPRTIQKEINGHSMFFIHYHIEPHKLNDHISNDPFSDIVDPSLENMQQIFKNHQDDLICFGHHHPIHYFQDNRSIYLNAGALGCSHDPIATYAIVTVYDNKIEVSLEKTTYDKTAFLDSFHKLQVPGKEFLLKAFHGQT